MLDLCLETSIRAEIEVDELRSQSANYQSEIFPKRRKRNALRGRGRGLLLSPCQTFVIINKIHHHTCTTSASRKIIYKTCVERQIQVDYTAFVCRISAVIVEFSPCRNLRGLTRNERGVGIHYSVFPSLTSFPPGPSSTSRKRLPFIFIKMSSFEVGCKLKLEKIFFLCQLRTNTRPGTSAPF